MSDKHEKQKQTQEEVENNKREILQILGELQENGLNSLDTINQQGEQIDKCNTKMTVIDEKISLGERIHRRIISTFNFFNTQQKIDDTRDKIEQDITRSKFETGKAKVGGTISRYSNKVKNEIIKNKSRYNMEASDSEEEPTFEEECMRAVNNLKEINSNIGEKLVEYNKILDEEISRVDYSDDKLRNLNKKLRKV
jgi:hypothetical protein